jgi:hypothetical protein
MERLADVARVHQNDGFWMYLEVLKLLRVAARDEKNFESNKEHNSL